MLQENKIKMYFFPTCVRVCRSTVRTGTSTRYRCKIYGIASFLVSIILASCGTFSSILLMSYQCRNSDGFERLCVTEFVFHSSMHSLVDCDVDFVDTVTAAAI